MMPRPIVQTYYRFRHKMTLLAEVPLALDLPTSFGPLFGQVHNFDTACVKAIQARAKAKPSNG